tara:strand:- start:74 stop:544 length:471 start_codon:yes stop_codon:yes gene_type:complete
MNDINRIKLLVYDFDGVMTNNEVYLDQDGKETVQVNRADGLAVSEIERLGIEQLIISTEKNPVVSVRAKKLGLNYVQGSSNKKKSLMELIQKNNINIKNVAYVGNDINDKEVMAFVGIAFCPADAHKSIKIISDKVLKTNGGKGVIREILDLLIKK